MHFQMAAMYMYILKDTIKCNVINHGIAHNISVHVHWSTGFKRQNIEEKKPSYQAWAGELKKVCIKMKLR